MAARPSLFCHSHNAVFRSRDGALHEQEIPLRVHSHDPQSQLGMTLGAHVPWHPLPLDDAGWIGTRADRAWLPVAGVAVGCRASAEVIPVNHALEASALGGAGDFHQLARGEDVYFHLGSSRRSLTVDGEHPQDLRRRLETRLLRVSQLRLAGALGPAGTEAELHTTIAHLHHAAGTGFDDRHRYRRAVFLEDACHAELAADQSHAHCYSTLISTSTPAGRSSLVSASIVWGRESLMSMSRLWVRSSNCSRLFLSTWGLRSTVHRSVLTGSGMGPETCAPVFSAVRTISAAAWSRTT